MAEITVKAGDDRDFTKEYFVPLVEGWVKKQAAMGITPKHHTVSVTAGPYRSSAVSAEQGVAGTPDEGILKLDFYSAIRNGFGGLSSSDVDAIIKEWL